MRSRSYLLIPLSLAVLTVGIVSLWQLGRSQRLNSRPPLTIFCAAGLRPAMESLGRLYTQQQGTQVAVQYGPSGAIEVQSQLSGRGDLFLPAAADPYLTRAQQTGMVTKVVPLATMRLVVALNAAVDFEGKSCAELIESNLEYGLANPQAAVGLHTERALTSARLWETAKQNARVFLPTVNELAEAIRQGDQVQAGIVWDATARQYGLQIVEAPELAAGVGGAAKSVAIGLLKSSREHEAAQKFLELATSERGQRMFEQQFYSTP